MTVLLLEDIKNVGKRHEIKEVSDGYARNFLIVRKLAVPADEKALVIKSQLEKQEQFSQKKYQTLAERLKTERLRFFVKTGSKGEIFGSVNEAEIKRALKERGFENARAVLNKPLKALGEHRLEVIFPGGLKAEVLIILDRLT